MELFRKIRLGNGRAILQRKVARLKREIRYSDFADVSSIGIVWDASNISEFPVLSRFHQKMQDAKIDVKIFGYFPGLVLPDQYTAIRYLICIRKDELTKLYLPDSREATLFINTPFDVLIDINLNNELPLSYVSGLSKARLKVGLFEKEATSQPFDIMIEMTPPIDIEGYLSQAIHYLKMIKSKTKKRFNN